MNIFVITFSQLKQLVLTISILIFLGSCTSHKNISKITLSIDDSFTNEEQWCYISGFKSWVSGNESWIFDSVQIAKGQKKVKMKVIHPCETDFYLTFSKSGPTDANFVLESNSRILMQIIPMNNNNNEGSLLLSGKGSNAHNEEENFRKHIIKPLRKKIENSNRKDSIEYYSNLLALNGIEYVKNTKHPCNAYSNFLGLRTSHSSYVEKYITISDLKQYIVNKFPEICYIQELNEEEHLPPSKESQFYSQKIEHLLKTKNNKFKQSTNIGSKINLEFYDSQNNLISLDQIKKEYILVDFWASWCKPCQKEVPYLKKALSKYGDRLCIYAVSIDKYFDIWQNAILRDSTQNFIHVLGSDQQGLPNKQIQGLGIKSFPSNLLLNNKLEIIAKDLRGKKIIETLDSIIAGSESKTY